MRLDVPRLVVALVLAGASVVVFLRATQGGGPIYYFFAAVLLGMGIAAFQGARGQGGTSGKDGSQAAGRKKGGGTR